MINLRPCALGVISLLLRNLNLVTYIDKHLNCQLKEKLVFITLLWNARTHHTRALALVRALKAATRRRIPKQISFILSPEF